MRKTVLTIVMILLLAASAAAENDTRTLTVAADPGADAFTTAETFTGRFNLSISGSSWSGTVTLQRSFDSGSTWVDVATFTANKETTISEPQRNGLPYRVGIKSGDYTSGTVNLRLTK